MSLAPLDVVPADEAGGRGRSNVYEVIMGRLNTMILCCVIYGCTFGLIDHLCAALSWH